MSGPAVSHCHTGRAPWLKDPELISCQGHSSCPELPQEHVCLDIHLSLCLLGIWATNTGRVCVPTDVLAPCPTKGYGKHRESRQEKALARAVGPGAELERQL